MALEIPGQTPVAADPGKRTLDDPTLRYDDELVQLVALHDLDDPVSGAGRSQSDARSLIPGIGEDAKDEGEQGARPLGQNQCGAVTVLDIGGMNGDAQQEAERIDEDMAFAPRDLLGRVKPLRIEQSPPLGAPFALWLSMMAAVGLASRPSCSRTAT